MQMRTTLCLKLVHETAILFQAILSQCLFLRKSTFIQEIGYHKTEYPT